ncbi:LOW QUALITY PROTEIN: hypothetical protein YC2023_114117 [Brassica napus]
MVVVEKTERKRSLRRSPQNIAFRLRPEDLHGKLEQPKTETWVDRGGSEADRRRSGSEAPANPPRVLSIHDLAITPERLGMHLEIVLIRRIRPVSKRKTRDDEARRRWGKQSSTGLRMDRGSDLGWRPTTNDHCRPPETRFRRGSVVDVLSFRLLILWTRCMDMFSVLNEPSWTSHCGYTVIDEQSWTNHHEWASMTSGEFTNHQDKLIWAFDMWTTGGEFTNQQFGPP